MAELFPECAHYVDTYDRFGLLGRRSVLAHNVHPTDAELDVLAGTGASVAHCPSSNSALGSGLFPLRRHVERGVRVALGTDVGAGTGFSLLREGLQAYFMQALLGYPLRPAHLLWMATRAGAAALDLEDVGDLSVGRQFDAVWVRPPPAPRSTGCSATPTTPTTHWPRFSPWPARPTCAASWVAGDSVR